MAFRPPRPLPRNVQACLLATRGDIKTSLPQKRSHSARSSKAPSESHSGQNSRRVSLDLFDSVDAFASKLGDITFSSTMCQLHAEDLIPHLQTISGVQFIVAPGSKFRRSLYRRRMTRSESRKSCAGDKKLQPLKDMSADLIESKTPTIVQFSADNVSTDDKDENSKLDHETTNDKSDAPRPRAPIRRKTPIAQGYVAVAKEANFQIDSDHPEEKQDSRCTTPTRPKTHKQLAPLLPSVAGISASNAKDAKEEKTFDSLGTFKYSFEGKPMQSYAFSSKRARSPCMLPKITP